MKKNKKKNIDFNNKKILSNIHKDKIISHFDFKGFDCIFYKDNKKFILTYQKGNNVRVLIFLKLKDLISKIVENDLLERNKKF